MANPQTENGHIKIANEIVEALAKIRISGEESQVLWVVLRKTYGWKKKSDWIPISQFVEITGIKKTNVLRAIKRLVVKKIIMVLKKDTTNGLKVPQVFEFNKNYDMWVPVVKKRPGSKNTTKVVSKTLPKLVAKTLPSKEKKATIKRKQPTYHVFYNIETKLFEGITMEEIKIWERAYNLINVRDTLYDMCVKIPGNYEDRKDWKRFIQNWLIGEQRRARERNERRA